MNPYSQSRTARCLRKRRVLLKAWGICVDCGKQAVVEGRTLCGNCLADRRIRQERSRRAAELHEAKLCIVKSAIQGELTA